MADLHEIVAFLDQELRTAEITDYPGAVNGLQLASDGGVRHVIAAVDASLPVIQAAAEKGPNGLLIVHHGMFWQGARPLTGAFYRKIKIAMDAGLAIYSSHLPLDVHPEFGNNAVLARLIGMKNPEPAMEHKGLQIGIKGEWEGSRDELAAKVGTAVGGRVHLCPAGPERIRSIVLVTGGAGSEVEKAAGTGADAFLSGEAPHWAYPMAEELGINLLLAGHYATEVFGVQEIASFVARTFKLPLAFIDHPTGL
jgi:dinuclear metal center YbgI/SA1388 family protein